MKPCKHGHVDCVMHMPCPQCIVDLRFENQMLLCGQIDALKERIAKLESGLRECREAVKYTGSYESVTKLVDDLLGGENG